MTSAPRVNSHDPYNLQVPDSSDVRDGSDVSGERRQTILILENAPGSRSMLDLTLRAASYNVVAAESSEDAWSLIRRGEIDLVIADLHIRAHADGLELIQRIHADLGGAHVPVIVTSGERREELRQAALAAGAHAYLTKPYDRRDLLAHIGQCLGD